MWRKSMLTSRARNKVKKRRGAFADIRLKRTISGTAQSWGCVWMTITMKMFHASAGATRPPSVFRCKRGTTSLAVEVDRRFSYTRYECRWYLTHHITVAAGLHICGKYKKHGTITYLQHFPSIYSYIRVQSISIYNLSRSQVGPKSVLSRSQV